MLRPRLRIPRASLLQRPKPSVRTRAIHSTPYLDQFVPEEGVPGLLTPGGFDFAWTQYMKLVTNKLSALTAGTDFEQQPALQIVKATAREPSTAALFNYASMAHNNHFFFKNLVNHGLKDIPDHAQPEPGQLLDPSLVQVDIPPSLKKEIEDYFSSVETLRLEMAATANAMFGPGFVWLVKNAQSKGLKILTTYLAGTPYTAGHWRRQGADMNTAGIEATKEFLERTQAGAGGATERRYAKTSQIAPGGTDVIPLLCLNTWEHVWLRDYGLGADGPGGKRDYVNRWWYCIDWNKVQELSSPGGKNVPKIK